MRSRGLCCSQNSESTSRIQHRNTRATMGSQSKKPISSRGSASDQFPGKLHDLMTFIEMEGLTDIISWVRNGQAIMVHDTDRLLKLLPIFGLSQTKYRSFERQLNMWHWERITAGPNKGAWMHPCFIRGNKVLCSYMSRHSSGPKPHVPLHWMCPTKLIPNSEKIDSNRLSNMISRGIRDLANEAFCMDDICFSKAPHDTFSDQIKPTSPIMDGMCESLSDLLARKEIMTGGVEDKHFNDQGDLYISDSVLEPTPLREDFLSDNDISYFMSHKFLSEESDVVFRDDFRSCHSINLLLEPLADETIEDFF